MKFLALSVILALAVTLSSGFSVEHALHQEWSLFKVIYSKLATEFSYEENFDTYRSLMARPTQPPKKNSA